MTLITVVLPAQTYDVADGQTTDVTSITNAGGTVTKNGTGTLAVSGTIDLDGTAGATGSDGADAVEPVDEIDFGTAAEIGAMGDPGTDAGQTNVNAGTLTATKIQANGGDGGAGGNGGAVGNDKDAANPVTGGQGGTGAKGGSISIAAGTTATVTTVEMLGGNGGEGGAGGGEGGTAGDGGDGGSGGTVTVSGTLNTNHISLVGGNPGDSPASPAPGNVGIAGSGGSIIISSGGILNLTGGADLRGGILGGTQGTGGSISVASGGRLAWTGGTIDLSGSTNGTLDVTGTLATTESQLNSSLIGTLTLNAGATIQLTEAAVTYSGGATTSQTLITGLSSTTRTVAIDNTLNVTSNLTVAANGTLSAGTLDVQGATLAISGGGDVTATTAQLGFAPANPNSIVTVTGTGSTFVSSNLTIGTSAANNSVTVSGGATGSSGNLFLGEFGGADSNSFTVENSGSQFTLTGRLDIGQNGDNNTLSVLDGATFAANAESNIGFHTENLPSTANSTGNALIVDGEGSTFTTNGNILNVGLSGDTNSVTVSDGGSLATNLLFVGRNEAATSNNVTVTGTNVHGTDSKITTTSSFGVGVNGDSNTTDVLLGGDVVAGAASYVGYGVNSSGNILTVDGAGSTFTVTNDSLTVGWSGDSNTLDIENGGVVTSTGGFVGREATATGNIVNVTGTDSAWNNTGALTIGNASDPSANNVVNVGTGGTISTDSLVINRGANGNAFNLNSGGTLSVGGAFDAGTTGFTFNSGGILSVEGVLSNLDSLSAGQSVALDGNAATWSPSGNIDDGNTSIANGATLSVGALDATNLTFTSGTLNVSGLLENYTSIANQTLNLNSGSSWNAGNSATLNGQVIVNGGTLTATGPLSGSLNLNGGVLDITSGSLNGSMGYFTGGELKVSSFDLGSITDHFSSTPLGGTIRGMGGLTGTLNSDQSLIIDSGGTWSDYASGDKVTLDGGTMSVGAFSANEANFYFTSGTLNTTGALSNLNSLSTGQTVELSGGSASWSPSGNIDSGNTSIDNGATLSVGALDATNLTFTNGTLNATGTLTDIGTILANQTVGLSGSGSFGTSTTLNGGTVNAGDFNFTGGNLTFTSGTLNVSGLLENYASIANQTLNLNSGSSWNAGDETIFGGSVNLNSGGTLNVAGFNAGQMGFTFTNGTLNATGTLTDVGTIDADQTVGLSGSGSFAQVSAVNDLDGGTVNVGDFNFTGGNLTFTSGTLNVSGLLENYASIANQTLNLVSGGSWATSDSDVYGTVNIEDEGTLTAHNTGIYGTTTIKTGGTMTWTGTRGGSSIVNLVGGTLNVDGLTADGGRGNFFYYELGSGFTGTLNLSNANLLNYLDGFNQTLNLNSDSVWDLGFGTRFLHANTIINVNHGGTMIGAPDITSASGELNINDGGVLVLSENSDLESVSGGEFNLNSGGTLRVGDGGTSGTLSSSLTNNGNITFNRSDEVLFGYAISGTGSLTKEGAGTLTLSGANTFTGDTSIIGGTLKLGHSDALAGSTLTTASGLSFGTLTTAKLGGLSGSDNLTLQNTAAGAVALDVGSNDTDTSYTGTLSGSGSLTKSGNGTLELSGDNSYTGGTTLSAGTIEVGHNDALGTGTLDFAGGTLSGDGTARTLTNNLSASAGVQVGGASDLAFTGAFDLGAAAPRTFNISNTADTTFSGVISNGGIAKTGTGTLTLSGANSYSGGTTVAAGTLSLAHDNAAGTGNITTTGSVIDYADDVTISNNLDLQSNSTQLQVLSGSSATHSGVISETGGSRPLEKIGGGTLTLTGDNEYTGGTTLTAGTIEVGHNDALGTGTLTFSGGTLAGDGTARTLANPLSASADVQVGGASDLAFTGAFDLGAAAPRTFNISNTADTTFSGVISNGGIAKTGTGTLTLSGANSYSGGTTVSAGTLALGHATDTLADSGAISIAGGTLALGGNSDTVGAVSMSSGSITGTGTLTGSSYEFTNSGTVAADLAGNGGLIKTGSGILTLSGNNTYSGATNVNEGTLTIGAANALSPNTALNLTGGTLNVGAFDASKLSTFTSGTLNVSGSLTEYTSGAGQTLTLDFNSGATWDAGENPIIAGIVNIGSGTSMTTTGDTGPTLSAAGALNLDGGTLNVGSFNAEHLTSFQGGTLSVSGALTKLDTLGLGQEVQLSGGSANWSPARGINDGSITVANGATLTLTSYVDDLTFQNHNPSLQNISVNNGIVNLSGTITDAQSIAGSGGGSITLNVLSSGRIQASDSNHTLAIGHNSSDNIVRVSNGGGISNYAGISVGEDFTNSNQLIVTGNTSSVSTVGSISVEGDGTTISVLDGATLSANSLDVGGFSSSVTVSGTNSTLNATTVVRVGEPSSGSSNTLNLNTGGTLSTPSLQVASNNTFNLQGGTLNIGTFDTNQPGSFNFTSGTLKSTGTLSNLGSLGNGQTVDLTGGGTLGTAINLTGGTLATNAFDAGQLTTFSSGSLNVGGVLTSYTSGNGQTLNLNSGGSWAPGANPALAGTVNINASSSMTATGSILSPSGTLNLIGGTLNVGAFDASQSGFTFTSGTLNTTGVLTNYTSTANQTLNLNSGASWNAGDNPSLEGTVNVTTGSTMTASGTTGPSLTGGALNLTGGTLNVGNFDGTNLSSFSSGTLNVTGNLTNFNASYPAELNLNAGSFWNAGTSPSFDPTVNLKGGTLQVAGTFDMTNFTSTPEGTLVSTGVIQNPSPIGSNLTIDISSGGSFSTTPTLSGGTLVVGDYNAGAVTFNSGTLRATGALTNLSGVTTNQTVQLDGAGASVDFTAAANLTGGTLSLDNGATATIRSNLTATSDSGLTFGSGGGTIDLDSGLLNIASLSTALTLNANSSLTGNGTIFGPVALGTGGTLNGDAAQGGLTLFGNLTGTGTVANTSIFGTVTVGNSPGHINYVNTTLNAGTIVNIAIEGAASGEYDTISIDATSNVAAATLNITFENYTPSVGATWALVTNSSGTSFSTINTPSGWTFNGTTLSAVPEPSSFAALVALLALGFTATRRRPRQ